MADTIEYIVDMVVHCSHSVKTYFCGWRERFVVVVKVYGTWIKAIEPSVGGEFAGGGGIGVVGKFSKR